MQRVSILLITILLSVTNVIASKISISGVTVAKKQQLLLYEFNFESMDYEPVAKTVTSKNGNFNFEIDFSGPNMYKMDIVDGSVVYLAIEGPRVNFV